jgi:agmatine/peptidylarginine deiminase
MLERVIHQIRLHRKETTEVKHGNKILLLVMPVAVVVALQQLAELQQTVLAVVAALARHQQLQVLVSHTPEAAAAAAERPLDLADRAVEVLVAMLMSLLP